MSARHQRGFVAIEWVAAIGLLLLPVVLLVATLPVWAERRHGATVAAREAARVLVDGWPRADPKAANEVALEVAVDHGIAADDVAVHVLATGTHRGDDVRVEVVVTMPAISVGGAVVGRWEYTDTAVRRVDDFRSR